MEVLFINTVQKKTIPKSKKLLLYAIIGISHKNGLYSWEPMDPQNPLFH